MEMNNGWNEQSIEVNNRLSRAALARTTIGASESEPTHSAAYLKFKEFAFVESAIQINN